MRLFIGVVEASVTSHILACTHSPILVIAIFLNKEFNDLNKKNKDVQLSCKNTLHYTRTLFFIFITKDRFLLFLLHVS